MFMSYVACVIYSKYMQATNGVLNSSRDSALEWRSLVVFDYKPQKRKKQQKKSMCFKPLKVHLYIETEAKYLLKKYFFLN